MPSFVLAALLAMGITLGSQVQSAQFPLGEEFSPGQSQAGLAVAQGRVIAAALEHGPQVSPQQEHEGPEAMPAESVQGLCTAHQAVQLAGRAGVNVTAATERLAHLLGAAEVTTLEVTCADASLLADEAVDGSGASGGPPESVPLGPPGAASPP